MRSLCLVCVLGCSSPAAKPPSNSSSAASALPGACVDPVADATKRLAGVEGDPVQAVPAPDLDSDGTPDRAVPIGLGVITHTLLYVMRGACGHYVGDVGGPPQDGATTKTKGFTDVKVLDAASCEGAKCGCDPGELWFRFDGAEYKKDAAASKPGHEKPCKD